MNGRREQAPGQAPGRKISCGSSRIERAAPNILWCPLVERRLRRMGDVLGALNYLGGQASQDEIAWILGCTTRTVRTGAARARGLGLLERLSPCASLQVTPDGRSWWQTVPKVPVRREEYLKFTPAQVRALEVGLHGLQSGQRGVAKRARVSARTVLTAFNRAGVHVIPGSYVFRGHSSDGFKLWFKKLRSYGYLAAGAFLALSGSICGTKTPSTHPHSSAGSNTPLVTHADRANPPPGGRISPTAAPLPRRTWRPYGAGKGTNSGLSSAAGALSWL